MEIQTYMYWSVSIAATLFSIVVIGGLIASFAIAKRLSRIFDKLEAMSDAGLAASHTMQSFVEKSTTSISAFVQTFLTLKGAREVASHIGEAIAHARDKSKRKETTDGEHQPK